MHALRLFLMDDTESSPDMCPVGNIWLLSQNISAINPQRRATSLNPSMHFRWTHRYSGQFSKNMPAARYEKQCHEVSAYHSFQNKMYFDVDGAKALNRLLTVLVRYCSWILRWGTEATMQAWLWTSQPTQACDYLARQVRFLTEANWPLPSPKSHQHDKMVLKEFN